jgi:hypothetical protein
MFRTRSARIALLFALSLPVPAVAQVSGIQNQRPKAPDAAGPRVLVVDPAPAPVPALKYRLLPSWAERNPGDAAPIYLRIRYQIADQLWSEIEPNHLKWRDVPIDRLPTAEVRKFVDQFGKQLELIGFGAHRRDCDWSYTLPEQRLDQLNLNLADAQVMRHWLRLLDLKARVEIAEGNPDQALKTIETGMAFSRHIAEGTFVINGLIGLAGVGVLLGDVEELIARPGAPNLYWALTALPRPLIDLRREIENEQKLCENLIPELADALSDRSWSPSEWAVLLSRMHQGIAKWCRFFGAGSGPADSRLKTIGDWDLARLKAETLPAARDYLKATRGLGDRQIAEMPEDQLVALYLAGRYRELWDDLFKASYLPARQAFAQIAAAEKRLIAAKSGPTALFFAMIPNIQAVMTGGLRIDRRAAVLRVIEAIRLHAASHGGQLPEALAQITEVPVPEDPATGEPFSYRVADSTATLEGPRANLPYPPPSYRITIRH